MKKKRRRCRNGSEEMNGKKKRKLRQEGELEDKEKKNWIKEDEEMELTRSMGKRKEKG